LTNVGIARQPCQVAQKPVQLRVILTSSSETRPQGARLSMIAPRATFGQPAADLVRPIAVGWSVNSEIGLMAGPAAQRRRHRTNEKEFEIAEMLGM